MKCHDPRVEQDPLVIFIQKDFTTKASSDQELLIVNYFEDLLALEDQAGIILVNVTVMYQSLKRT